METGIDTEVVEYPHAKLVGIQFGLLSTKDVMKISVFHKSGEPDLAVKKKLTDARLGLPNVENECRTCGERVTQKCEGHFGHLVFPYPVYHPNHVSDIAKILNSLCLSCLSMKKIVKKKLRELETLEDMIDGITAIHFDDKAGVKKGNLGPTKVETTCFDLFSPASCSKTPFRPKEEPEDLSSVAVLNGIEKLPTSSGGNEAAQEGFLRPTIIDLTSDGEDDDMECLKSKAPFPTNGQKAKSNTPSSKYPEQIPSPKTSVLKKKKAKAGGMEGGKKRVCKYCKKGEYPKLNAKVERVQSNKNVVEKICLELDEDDISPDEYLKLLGKKAEDFDSGKQYLLPSEALKILASLSDKVVQQLKFDGNISRPEALVVESLLLPPNCNRIPERPLGGDQMRFGSDKVTNMLSKVLSKLPVMKASKATVMTNRIAVDEMQCLVADYLRIKGAPKVRGNKEPSIDYVRAGKATKQRIKISLNNLQKHVAAKVSSFSCRAVLTGDTFLMLDEIGIPFEIAKGLTVCETVTEHNLQKMQEVVDNGSRSSTKTGALHYIRAGVKKDLTHCELITLAVGDVIGRHLQDGDFIFCNRPPSVHKHSMLGLRAHILDIPTIAINPLVCTPLGADFDGDCLAAFVPQSVESKTEIKELMMVQKQMLTSHGGQCTFTLTQDALLAAHKITSSHVFISRKTMEQGSMCTGSNIPKPTIVKSPKGPFWTGTQFFELCLPYGLEYTRDNVLIVDSEILVTDGQPEWLGSSSDSLLKTIIFQHGGDAAINYLGLCQLNLVQWLSQVGFTVGLYDVYATARWSTRGSLKREIRKMLVEKENNVNNKVQELSLQLSQPSEEEVFARGCPRIPLDTPMNGLFTATLEKLRLQYMLTMLAEVEDSALKHVCSDNSILAMVKAGSKGTIRKFVEQFGFLGMQLYKGKYMHPRKKVQPLKSATNQSAMEIAQSKSKATTWEEGGLVKNAYVEGLMPQEFFIHTVSYREAMIRQALRVSEPGYLYKNMMLFARDIYIDYDGTVRNHHNRHLIQFQYGGAKYDSENSCNMDQKVKNVCRSRWDDTVLAGEPVGILAATAITQPAYQMLLESPNQLNELAICPLELLQETLYSRRSSVLKQCDQRVVLYLSEAHGHSKESAAIKVHQLLQHVTLENLLLTSSVNFGGGSNAGTWKGLLPAKKSPWIVHLSFHKLAMDTWNVSIECIVQKLKSTHEIHQFGALSFFSRECCDASCPGSIGSENSPCISFCVTHAQSPSIEESLSRMRNQILPRVIQVSIMGNKCIESVAVVPADVSSEPWISDIAKTESSPLKNVVVVEVIVKKSSLKQKHDAWLVVQELCGPVFDLIDWSRSIPSSIQGIASVYGIEAAHSCIYQRLKAVLTMFDKTVYTQHMLLMADLMTHSGNVIGLNAAGFREFSNALSVSAPMTQSLFQNSIKHIQNAALKGKCDNLSGTLPSICWGKPAPVGTGAKFELIWRDVAR